MPEPSATICKSVEIKILVFLVPINGLRHVKLKPLQRVRLIEIEADIRGPNRIRPARPGRCARIDRVRQPKQVRVMDHCGTQEQV